ncbi:hypothetical protein CC77DRAFT_1052613 [Alternaria alternata]|jgi:hypothetical protein|uniref:Uncharacterized protein n=1 Tax=Alternaria alternata TaxID=5599 RepID=A0A177DD80_ALTAL|nr:hypothetical protein CC77DRAFT_1052613 [Alternaria alternata]KAH6846780.1 hypothetical protein B0T12DRAFT_232620 [Alternaria alternata]OAG17665.1 hypothetical protein CC77DRAFT_1052613 [Alternaria alternata]
MGFFVPLALLIAAVWCTVGILLARWLKQSGHARPFKGRTFSSRELYGGGVGYGRVENSFGQGAASEGRGQEGRERGVGIPLTGVGRVKGV